MFESLETLLKSGLDGDSTKVREAAQEYIKANYTKVKSLNMPYEYRLAKRFKKVLDERNEDK